MTDQDPSVNPADDGVSDEDEAAIDEALDALTTTATLDDADDDDVVEDEVGEDDDFDDEPDLEEDVPVLDPSQVTVHVSEPDDEEEDTAEPAVVATAAPTADDQRLEQLEMVAQALTAAAIKRDDGRVRRKVSASASGAAVVGAIPVILQLAGALHLSPELSATVAAVAATLASFLSGYLTPERPPTVQPELASQVLKQP